MVNGSGVSRGDRNRNTRLARLRELVPVENATDPELGGRVDRGNPLAQGHDGITAELKVERKVAVTKESAPKYIGQPTQYAAADGARLSILTILDMSPKTLPVGTPENYLFTLEPRLHGLDNPEAPSLVVLVVMDRYGFHAASL